VVWLFHAIIRMYHLKSSFHFKMKTKDIDDYFMLVHPHERKCKQVQKTKAKTVAIQVKIAFAVHASVASGTKSSYLHQNSSRRLQVKRRR
jgi:hypothetical protein